MLLQRDSHHPVLDHVSRFVLSLTLAAVGSLAFRQSASAQTGSGETFTPGARQVFVPSLDAGSADGASCTAEMVVQNVGDEWSKAVMVFWGEAGECAPSANGPLKVECTGLIKPGEVWRVNGPMMAAGAHSAIVYSATVKMLSEIGVDPGFDDIVADHLCETMFFGLIGDADDTARFLRAVNTGGEFAGLPMDRVLGAPLSVLVDQTCDDGATYYAGISSAEAPESVSAAGTTFEYESPLLAASPDRSGPARISAMNAGLECAVVEVFATAHGSADSATSIGGACPTRLPCATVSIAPGESIIIDPSAAGCSEVDGSVWLRSGQPLAVIADGFGPAGRMSAAAQRVPAARSGSGVAPGTSLDSRIERLSAPLVYHDYRGWDSIIHVGNTTGAEVSARIAVRDLGGDIIALRDLRLCPSGGRSLSLRDIPDLPGSWVGMVSIEVIGSALGGPRPDALTATVELTRRDLAGAVLSSAAYDVRPAAPGSSVIGVPSIIKDSGGEGVSRLAIHNQVKTPGFTDYVIYFYDGSGLVDYVCLKLMANEVEYIDIETFVYVNRGFSGSAVISAAYWEHGERGAAGSENVVSLGAALVQAPGDGASSSVAPKAVEGPVRAVMLPSFDGTLEAGLPHCGSGVIDFRPRPRIRRIYMPYALSDRAEPLAGGPVFPTSEP